MSRASQLTELITTYSKPAIAIMVLLTVVVGAGAGMVDQSSSLDQFQSDSQAAQDLEYIESNFSTGPANQTRVQVIVRDDNVLDKASLVETLRLEQSFKTNATVTQTLAENRSVIGVPNLIARAALAESEAQALQQRAARLNATSQDLRAALATLEGNSSASPRTQFEAVKANSSLELNETDYTIFNQSVSQLRDAENDSQRQQAYERGTRGVLAEEYAQLQQDREALQRSPPPSLEAQIGAIEAMNQSELDRTIRRVISDSASGPVSPLAFMPTSYEPGEPTANATMVVVTQQLAGGTGGGPGGSAPEAVTEAQLAIQETAAQQSSSTELDTSVFGSGITSEEISNSMADSLVIVGPLAMLFVALALLIAYRDLIDILLGMVGIGAVLAWTFGFMGWADIAFNQMLIAVPVLLIGLSIDYAIHIFMRHREERQGLETGPRNSMMVALAGVGVALLWVTATTVIGFLSNLTSPIPPIRDFGIVSAVGITAALLVFGILIPALKIEIDEFLENRGWDRQKRAFGTGGGRFSDVLAVGAMAAKKAPFAVLLLAVLVSAGGAYGATQVDTSFSQTDFIAENPDGWMQELPEPFEPNEYSAKQNLEYVNENFLRQDSQAQLLIRGNVTSNDSLDVVANTSEHAAASDVTKKLATGEANIQSPLTVMNQTAAENASFNASFVAADTDGDGIPDQNIQTLYDQLYRVNPDDAASVVHRSEGGEYQALRIVVSTSGSASSGAVTSEMRAVAAGVGPNGAVRASATGQTILFDIVQDQLLDTVIQSLLITLVVVFCFLMLIYRIQEGSATLGAVTLLPVVFSVAWILGTMYLAGIPFNVLTGMITSLTVGLGVAYSIHLSERYNQELERTDSVWTAMNRALTGTGGALLGSATTTVGGFGVLAFAILPPLQQFGIITGMTIIYAFLASVLVLPSLLIIWTKYLNPDHDITAQSETTVSGGPVGSEDD